LHIKIAALLKCRHKHISYHHYRNTTRFLGRLKKIENPNQAYKCLHKYLIKIPRQVLKISLFISTFIMGCRGIGTMRAALR